VAVGGKEKSSCPCREKNPDPFVAEPVAELLHQQRYESAYITLCNHIKKNSFILATSTLFKKL
jgi:hypothetical protein